MRSRAFSTLLGAGLFGLALAISSAQAGTILVFGQKGTSDNFTATNNGSTGLAGGTTLSAVDIGVTITGIDNAVPLSASYPDAFFNLSATSVSNAALDGSGRITEEFTGWFSITSLSGGGGTNYLSGTFSDAVFGSGTGLTMTASGPSGVPTFTSAVIGELAQSRAISLSFANVTPAAAVTAEMTLGAFTSSVSGNFSATPEPASLVLLGMGVTALFAVRCFCKRAAVA
jgi:PEP-CTERM motif